MKKFGAFSTTQEAIRQESVYAAGLAQHPPNRARLALIERFDARTETTAFTIDAMMAILHGLGAGAAIPLDANSEASLRRQFSQTMHNGLLVGELFTYRDVTDAELEEYLSLWETPVFAWFTNAFKTAFLDVIERQSAVAASEVVKMVGPPSSRPLH